MVAATAKTGPALVRPVGEHAAHRTTSVRKPWAQPWCARKIEKDPARQPADGQPWKGFTCAQAPGEPAEDLVQMAAALPVNPEDVPQLTRRDQAGPRAAVMKAKMNRNGLRKLANEPQPEQAPISISMPPDKKSEK